MMATAAERDSPTMHETRVTTLQQLAGSLACDPAAPALIAFSADTRECLGGAELAARVEQQARWLCAAGLTPGAPLALLAPNGSAWVITALAAMRCAAVLVPLDSQLTGEPLAHVLHDCGARHLATTSGLQAAIEALALPVPPRVLLLDGPADPADGLELPEVDSAGPGERAVIFYTSGTTGQPKGVPLSHANLMSNVEAILAQRLVDRHDRLLVPLPLHHVYPFTVGLLAPLRQRSTLVLPYSLIGPQLIRALKEAAASALLGVPRLYESLVMAIDQRVAAGGGLARGFYRATLALSRLLRRFGARRPGRWLLASLHRRLAPNLRLVVSGGAALPAALAECLQDLGWEVATGYGLTETSPILTFNAPGRGDLASAGCALPGVALRTAEDASRAHPAEVQVRGPNVFAGYLNLPGKSAEAFTADGWFRTGDLGWLDARGFLHLAGRASEMIVLPGGENIDPEKIEQALKAAPGIQDVCVLEVDGRLRALLQPDMALLREAADETALREQLAQRVSAASAGLPSHHRVSDFRVSTDPLPRTRLGKLRRKEAAVRYRQAATSAAPRSGPLPVERMTPEDQQLLQLPAARATWEFLCARFPDRHLTPDSSPQLDLALDSLDWVGLGLELRERAGVDLPESGLGGWQSVRDLLRAAAAAAPAQGALPLLELLRRPDSLLDEDQRRWLSPRPAWQLAALRGLHALLRPLCRWAFHLQVEGRAELPGSGPFLLAPRHLSVLDPVIVGSVLDIATMRRLRWAGWTGMLFNGPLRRLISRIAGVLPVDPIASPRSSLAFGAAALAAGHGLVWFPEGRRSPDGTLQPLRAGIGLLLAAQPVPVIPVWLDGTQDAMPIGRRWPRRARIRVRFGAAATPEALAARGHGETEAERITAGLAATLQALERQP